QRDEPLVLRLNVFVSQAEAIEPIARDQLVFRRAGNDSLLQRKVGDVLISSAGRMGYLRRVAAPPVVQGERIVIATQRATLADVFESGRLRLTVTPQWPSQLLTLGLETRYAIPLA